MQLLRIVVVALVAAIAPATASAHGSGPLARTEAGLVRGFTADHTEKFLGIPYAAAPVGARRWRAPAPAAAWHGVRDATQYGARCPQLPSSNGAGSENEDCLSLNVFTPTGPRPRHHRPVLVFIHGGGLINGSGDQHDGAVLARRNGIVAVSFNYRLGVFGFLGHPSLSAEAGDHASGDYGVLDQQAAIGWVHRNIAAFGGDPRRVTIDGESAGGWSVCAQLASPLMRGLLAGAIIQSGSCASQPLSAAESAGTAYAASVGCPDTATAAACLRAKSPHDLLAATAGMQSMTITHGGRELPIAPADAVASGRFNRVPVINGSNHDEGRTFAQDLTDLDEQQYEAFVEGLFGAQAPQVLAQYPFDAFGSPYTSAYAIGAIWTDSGFIAGIGGCATLKLDREFARWTPSYAYQFDDRHAPGLNDHHPGYQWGAGHAMELAYLWPSFDNGTPLAAQFTPAQRELSHEMVRSWGTFARRGAPAGTWPAYRPGGRIQSLQPGGATHPIGEDEYAAEHKCAFWDAQ